MISIVQAPAYLTIQDEGWPASREAGLPVSGAMDRWAMAAANGMVGNPPGDAVFEWALTGGRLRFDRDATYAVYGPGVSISERVAAGTEVEMPRPVQGRFLYLAVGGGLAVPKMIGSRSTYLPAGIGRLLKAGNTVPLGAASITKGRMPSGALDYGADVVRVVAGPQRALFATADWEQFLQTTWRVSQASDRMGYRLEGDAPVTAPAADLPSEAACVGAVQVPPDGLPIVLMADGPTVGGYPKIAAVISADLGLMAQRVAGAPVRFRAVTMAEAQTAARARWSGLQLPSGDAGAS